MFLSIFNKGVWRKDEVNVLLMVFIYIYSKDSRINAKPTTFSLKFLKY